MPAEGNGGPVLRVRGLVKHFPIKGGLLGGTKGWVRAVDGVDFEVNAGETLGVVGESGCGKTTLGRLIVNLLDPSDGVIEFKGRALNEMEPEEQRALRREMQIVFQDPASSLNPRMTVRNIVGEPLVVNKVSRGEALSARVQELLDTVGLKPEHLNRFPHEFSGGQKQRIGIARALALHPDFLVLDEPTSALDVSVQAQVLNLLKDLQRRLGLTFVFITHALNVVNHISDRVAVMYLGKVVELAPTPALFATPKHPYTQALLSAIPSADLKEGKGKDRVILTGDVPSPVNPPSGCRFHTRCPIATEICNWDGDRLAERVRDDGGGERVFGDLSKWTRDRAGAVIPLEKERKSELERALAELLSPEAAKYRRTFWRVVDAEDGYRVDFEPPLAEQGGNHLAACFFAGTDITKAATKRAAAGRTDVDATGVARETERDLHEGIDQNLAGRETEKLPGAGRAEEAS